MSWSISWFLIRDRPLTGEERRAVATHVVDTMDAPWASGYDLHLAKSFRGDGLIGCGSLDLQVGATADAEKLCDALTALRAAAPGADVRVRDDFGSIGWNDAAQRFELCGARGEEAPPFPEILETRWILASALLPKREPQVTDPSDAGQLFDLLAHVGKSDRDRARGIAAQLEALPPEQVAPAGLARLAKLEYDGREVLDKAVRDLADPSLVRDQLSRVWSMPPPRGYWHSDLRWTLGPAAAKDPALLELLCRDLFTEDEGHRDRLRYTAETLAIARSGAAVPALVQRLRADRARSDWVPWRADTIKALAEIARPEAFATIVLEIASNDVVWMNGAVKGLVSCGGERAVPWLLRILETEQASPTVIEALAGFDRPEVAEAVARFRARQPADPFERLRSRGGEIRQAALEELFARKDPSLIHALLLADQLHHAIADRTGWPASVPAWDVYDDVIPEQGRYSKRHEWIPKNLARLPPQVIPEPLEDVRAGGAKVVAGRLAPHRIALTPEERATLEREEEQAAS